MNANQSPQEPTVTNDSTVLLGIYSAQSAARVDYNERKWETVRSASVLTFGLLAGIGAIATIVQENGLALILLGASLWIFGFIISNWTNSNIKRESELQYAVEFSMYQIEKLLGAHGVVPSTSRWLPTYKYILEKKHIYYKHNANIDENELQEDPLSAWVNGRMKNTNANFLKTVNRFSLMLLSICVWVGLVLLIIGILRLSGSATVAPITTIILTPTP